MKPLVAVLGALTAFGVPATATATATPVAVLDSSTAVKSYAGVQAWTDYDAADGLWHVMVRRNGRISRPTIAGARRAIEVDVGPSASSSPTLAYTSCSATCHVVVSELDGSHPRTVPGSGNASHPAIWGARVAWVSGAATVLSSRWDGTDRRRLGGAPHVKCYHALTTLSGHLMTCAPPQRPTVDGLALYGKRLALIDTFDLDDGIGANGTTSEVRTESVTGGPQQLVALISVGEGDEIWVGPSWAAGKLFFYMTSEGAGFIVDGFDPVHNTYVTARGSAYLTGFSVIDGGRRAYEATFPGDPRGGFKCDDRGALPCVLQLSGQFEFRPSKSLVHVP